MVRSSINRKKLEHKKPSILANSQRKLTTFDKWGRIYFPKLIRDLFAGYYFDILFEGGKIILDPIKIEDNPLFEEIEEEVDLDD